MKIKNPFNLILVAACTVIGGLALAATLTWAAPGAAPLAQGGGAPTVVAYQGQVQVNDTPFEGTGHFKFAVVNPAGDTSYWSNDGTSVGGAEPTAAVTLMVSDGLFSILLGDTSLGGMTQPLTADAFGEPDRHLRVWFSSDGSTFSQLTPDTRIAAVPYALQAERVRGYAGVVRVAKSGGDYTSVQAAVNSISDASADNPYLVWVAPGVYSETVTMKPYVHLQGAGQEATLITSTVDSGGFLPTQATLVLTHHVSLRDLTVGNSGVGDYNMALLATDGTTQTLVADVTAKARGNGSGNNYGVYLYGHSTGVTLLDVTALAENGAYNIGLYNYYGARATLRGGFFTGRGGNSSHGIGNGSDGSTLEAEGVTALSEGSTDTNYGMTNGGQATAILRGGSFTGRGGDYTHGIYNYNHDTILTANHVTALAEGGDSSNYGLRNSDNGIVTLHGGSFTAHGGGGAYGIYNYSNSTLEADNVTAVGEDGSISSYGLSNSTGAAATLHGGSFTAHGGGSGIQNYDSTLEAENVTALTEGGSGYNQGLASTSGNATAILRGGSFIARGGNEARGIYTWGDTATLEAEGIIALAENGSSNNHGLRIDSGTASVNRSTLEGVDYSVLRIGTAAITVSNSRLVAGAASSSVTCVLVTRGTTVSTDGSTCP